VPQADYSSSSLTIDRLEAVLASTQSYNIVSRDDRVDVSAPRAMRRCAKLIDKICHGQSDGRASTLHGAGVLALVAGGKKALTGFRGFWHMSCFGNQAVSRSGKMPAAPIAPRRSIGMGEPIR
jgi:hypothetical protein